MSVFRLRRARAAAWSPAMIPRSLMYGWLDAEKAETITQAGGAVSSWVDTVTGTAFVQATEASKPGYSATGFDGRRPGLTFDGTADHVAYTAGAIAWPNSGAFEIWALVDQQEVESSNATRQIVGWPNVGAGGLTLGRPNGVGAGGNKLRAIVGDGAATVNADGGSAFSGLCVARLRCDGSTATAYVNGTAGSTASVVPSFSGATRYRIGSAQGSSPSQYWKGSINCLLVTALLDDRWAIPLLAHLNARRVGL